MNYALRMREELLLRFPATDSPKSIFVEPDPKKAQVILLQAARDMGMTISTRIIDGDLHVWRMK
jgi:hypothetical protein